MIGEIAHFLALLSTLVLVGMLSFNCVFFFAKVNSNQLILSTRLFNQACWLIFVSFGLYVYLAATDDFSISYIANHSHSELPIFYKITSIWSAHEGSMFLWIVFLTLWSLLFVNFLKADHPLRKNTVLILGFIILGFMVFLLATSNPFERIFPFGALEGADINPVLQDPALVIHPPMLYLGYVGFVISFSFVTAYLVHGDFSIPWERDIRNWSLVAWIFLTAGITLGSWWAYYELGWGGYWFWDPVENVALMPWLAATAFMHSLFASSKSQILKTWTLFLGIMIFALSLFGAFIVRSGIIDSVHSFANDPQRGIYLLTFSGFMTMFSLAVLVYRMPSLNSSKPIVTGSKESFISMNNILMITSIFSIFLGVTYPLIVDALSGEKISIGPPYYNAIFSPIILIASIFIMLSVDALWQRGMRAINVLTAIAPPLLMSAAILYAIWAEFHIFSVITFVGILSGLLIMTSYLFQITTSFVLGKYINKGSAMSHIGLGLLFFSVSMNSMLSYDKNINLSLGQSQFIDSSITKFSFNSLDRNQASNHEVIAARVVIEQDNKILYLQPEKRKYLTRGQITSEAAIHASPIKDTYLTIGDQLEDGSWTFVLQVNYLIKWIWLSAILMATGIMMTIFKRQTS